MLALLSDICGNTIYITMDLQESCRRLHNRISYDFGYGNTLVQKQKENQVAIDQAEKLVSGMKALI